MTSATYADQPVTARCGAAELEAHIRHQGCNAGANVVLAGRDSQALDAPVINVVLVATHSQSNGYTNLTDDPSAQ